MQKKERNEELEYIDDFENIEEPEESEDNREELEEAGADIIRRTRRGIFRRRQTQEERKKIRYKECSFCGRGISKLGNYDCSSGADCYVFKSFCVN